MKVTIKSIGQIVDDNLTLEERGILITIIALKDVTPKLTLAKVRSSIKLSKHYESLIKLHDNGFIVWSGYKAAKKSLEQKKPDPRISEIILFLNGLYKMRVGIETQSVVTLIRALLKDYSVDEIKSVVANRYVVWKDNPKMKGHLKPQTVFRKSKFEKYFEEVSRTKEGESFVTASALSLEKGSEITLEIAKKLTQNDVYNIRLCNFVNGDYEKGSLSKRLGKDLVSSLRFRDSETKMSGIESFKVIYEGNV